MTYVVANPRGIPKGIRILRIGDKEWFEGDTYDGPTKEGRAPHRFITDGFVVEVPNG